MVSKESPATGTSSVPGTVRVKLSLIDAPKLSVAVTVTSEMPFWCRARTRVNVLPAVLSRSNRPGLLVTRT